MNHDRAVGPQPSEPLLAGNGWRFRDDPGFSRWQLDYPDGMMAGIVERPFVTFPGDHQVYVPLGWTWRNTWGGPTRWEPTRWRAMQAARDEAIHLAGSEYAP